MDTLHNEAPPHLVGREVPANLVRHGRSPPRGVSPLNNGMWSLPDYEVPAHLVRHCQSPPRGTPTHSDPWLFSTHRLLFVTLGHALPLFGHSQSSTTHTKIGHMHHSQGPRCNQAQVAPSSDKCMNTVNLQLDPHLTNYGNQHSGERFI